MKLEIKPLRPNVVIPHFSTEDKNQMIFHADLQNEDTDETLIMPRNSTKVRTGISISVEDGYYPLIKATGELKSVGVSCGVIIENGTEELIVVLHNSSSAAVHIKDGEAIASGIFVQVATESNTEILLGEYLGQ